MRRLAPLLGILMAVVVGYLAASNFSAASIGMSIGRSLAGLAGIGMAGLMLGVALTVLVTFVLNGLIRVNISLLDVDFIDEIPLVFAALGGVVGIIWSSRWPEMLGLLGWGLLGLVITESLFRKPDNAER